MITVCTGSLPPNVPILLSSTAGQTQATISWVVTSVAYTLETYSISYGLSSDTLDMTNYLTEGSSNYTVTNQAYSATITGLDPFTLYYYVIVAQNTFTTTESAVQMFKTTEAGTYTLHGLMPLLLEDHYFFTTAPTAPPNSFSTTSIGSRNVALAWTLPEESGRNGVIISHTVMCSESNGDLISTLSTTNFTVTLEDLSPHTSYNCSVYAFTSIGSGPATTVNFTTADDGKLMYCYSADVT